MGEDEKITAVSSYKMKNEKDSENDLRKQINVQDLTERIMPREAIVKLYRLSDNIVNSILKRDLSQSPGNKNITSESSKNENRAKPEIGNRFKRVLRRRESQESHSQDILEKLLLPEMERRLTEWVHKRTRNGFGRAKKNKVIKKANQIFRRVKLQEGTKYENVKFFATNKWFTQFWNRIGSLTKQHPLNQCVSDTQCRLKHVIDDNKPTPISTPESRSDENEDWCVRTRTVLIQERARDLEIDTSTLVDLTEDNKEVCEQDKPTKLPQDLNSDVDDASQSEKTDINKKCVQHSEAVATDATRINKSTDSLSQDEIILQDEENEDSNNCEVFSVPSFSPSSLHSTETVLWMKENTKVPPFRNLNYESEPVQSFFRKLEQIIKREMYLPQQMFNVHQTTLFWKKLPTNCLVEEDSIASLPESKDPMSLLLGTNASGDCKLEPLLVYSKENPQPIRRIIKSSLPVIWKFHPRAKVTASLFEDWFTYSFVPSVQVFCMERKLPFKVLLLLDTAPCHSRILEFAHPNVKVIFIPPDIAPLLQPMEQGLSTSFKANYLKRMFEMLVEIVEQNEGATLQYFWNSFNILSALKLIKAAWTDISSQTITSAWKAVCSRSNPRDLDVPDLDPNIARLTIRFAERLQLQITERDITNWMDFHSYELSSKEVSILEQLNDIEDAIVDKEVPLATLTPVKLSEAFKCLDTAMKIFESEDPNFKRSSYVVDNIKRSYHCYRDIYTEQKKTSSHAISVYDVNDMDVDEDPYQSSSNPK